MLGQVTRVCSLAYDTYNKWLCVRLFSEEIKIFFRKNRDAKNFFDKKGGEDFFQEIFPKTRPRYPVNFDRPLRGAKTFFQIMRGGEDFFSDYFSHKTTSRYPVNFDRFLRGANTFPTKKGGWRLFFRHFFPITRSRYPVNFDRCSIRPAKMHLTSDIYQLPAKSTVNISLKLV